MNITNEMMANIKEKFCCGELVHITPERKAIGRNIIKLTDEYITKFRQKYRNTGIYCSVFKYDNCFEFQENQKYSGNLWGDFLIDFDNHDNNIQRWKDIQYEVGKLSYYLTGDLNISTNSIKILFTGRGFRFEISAFSMGVLPRKKLNFVYDEIRIFLMKELKLYTATNDFSDSRSLVSIENHLNPHLLPEKRHCIVLDNGQHNLSIEEIIGMSREMQFPSYKNNFEIDEKANCFFEERLEEYIKVTNNSTENKKVELTKVDIIENNKKIDEKSLDNHFAILDGLEQIEERKKEYPPEKSEITDKIRPCIKAYLEGGVPEGHRNKVCFIIATELRRLNYGETEAKKILLEWNEKNRPPVIEKEIAETLIKPIEFVYRNPLRNYGCNTNKYIVEKCVKKDICHYYKEYIGFNENITGNVNEEDFYKYHWDEKLSDKGEFYEILKKAEEIKKVGKGGRIITSMRQLAGYYLPKEKDCKTVNNIIKEYYEKGLIEYVPGINKKGSKKGSEITRIIPIPAPIDLKDRFKFHVPKQSGNIGTTVNFPTER